MDSDITARLRGGAGGPCPPSCLKSTIFSYFQKKTYMWQSFTYTVMQNRSSCECRSPNEQIRVPYRRRRPHVLASFPSSLSDLLRSFMSVCVHFRQGRGRRRLQVSDRGRRLRRGRRGKGRAKVYRFGGNPTAL